MEFILSFIILFELCMSEMKLESYVVGSAPLGL